MVHARRRWSAERIWGSWPTGEATDFASRSKPRELLALLEIAGVNQLFATAGPITPSPSP